MTANPEFPQGACDTCLHNNYFNRYNYQQTANVTGVEFLLLWCGDLKNLTQKWCNWRESYKLQIDLFAFLLRSEEKPNRINVCMWRGIISVTNTSSLAVIAGSSHVTDRCFVGLSIYHLTSLALSGVTGISRTHAIRQSQGTHPEQVTSPSQVTQPNRSLTLRPGDNLEFLMSWTCIFLCCLRKPGENPHTRGKHASSALLN